MNKFTLFLSILTLIFTPVSTTKASTTTNPEIKQYKSVETDLTFNEVATSNYQTTALSDITVGSPKIDIYFVPKKVVQPKPQPTSLKGVAEKMVTAHFGNGQFKAFESIVERESSWNPNAVNKSSGACGLPQALPCSKIKDQSPEGQIQWMINYIANRYGTPTNALLFWQLHHWY